MSLSAVSTITWSAGPVFPHFEAVTMPQRLNAVLTRVYDRNESNSTYHVRSRVMSYRTAGAPNIPAPFSSLFIWGYSGLG